MSNCNTRNNKFFKIALLSLVSFLFFSQNLYADECGSLRNHYGPFDYRTQKDKLPIVEDFHFTNVTYRLALIGEKSNKVYFRLFKFGAQGQGTIKNTPLVADLDYTLNTFPNHPKALHAMSEYQRIVGRPGAGLNYTAIGYRDVDCYFKRAILFAENDPVIYMLYGMNFHKRKKYKKALKQYKISEAINESNVELLYNIGLLYVDTGKKELAKQYAKRVYTQGYPLQGLQNKINKM